MLLISDAKLRQFTLGKEIMTSGLRDKVAD